MKTKIPILLLVFAFALAVLFGCLYRNMKNKYEYKQYLTDQMFLYNLHELSLELPPSSDGTYSAEQSAEIWRCLYFCETMLDYTSYADDEKLDKIMYRLYSWYELDVLSERIDSELVDAMVGMAVNLEVPAYVDRVYDMLFAEE